VNVPTPEIRVEARLRNNVLWHAIYDRFPSVAELCRQFPELHMQEVCGFINLTRSPKTRRGRWRPQAVLLAVALRTPEEELFPSRLYRLDNTRAVAELPLAALPPGAEELKALLPGPDDVVAGAELRREVLRALATLSPREEEVLRRRFGLNNDGDGETLAEIGAALGRDRERIRQIEAKALRKLRGKPAISAPLLDYWEES
jgi:RNA polymerase sigma factor (sigma-70 family)